MLLQDFSNRAEEYIRLSQRTHSQHDREFLVEMARAWCGVGEEPPQAPAPSTQTH